MCDHCSKKKCPDQVIKFKKNFRSSSLVVPPATPQSGSRRSPHSPGSRSLHLSRVSSPYHPSRESSPSYAAKGKRGSSASPNVSTCPEMFTFPPVPAPDTSDSVSISTRQTLSSVLHVQDSNLSSDDFHEALFFDRSPKSAKKRRRSKKQQQPVTPKRDLKDDLKIVDVQGQTSQPNNNTNNSNSNNNNNNSSGTGKKVIKNVSPTTATNSQQPSHICAHWKNVIFIVPKTAKYV